VAVAAAAAALTLVLLLGANLKILGSSWVPAEDGNETEYWQLVLSPVGTSTKVGRLDPCTRLTEPSLPTSKTTLESELQPAAGPPERLNATVNLAPEKSLAPVLTLSVWGTLMATEGWKFVVAVNVYRAVAVGELALTVDVAPPASLRLPLLAGNVTLYWHRAVSSPRLATKLGKDCPDARPTVPLLATERVTLEVAVQLLLELAVRANETAKVCPAKSLLLLPSAST